MSSSKRKGVQVLSSQNLHHHLLHYKAFPFFPNAVAAASILSGKQPPSIQHRILPIVDGKQPLLPAPPLPDTICLSFVHDVSYIHVVIKEVLSPVMILAFVSSLLFSPPSPRHQILFCNATFICDVPLLIITLLYNLNQYDQRGYCKVENKEMTTK